MSIASQKTIRLVQLSMLAALVAVLGFTPLGFIMVPPVSITIMHIPVIIGAVLLGPGAGAFLGLEFGLISIIRAATTPSGPVDLLFSPFSSGAPLQSIAMCILPRVALGLIAALGYRAIKNRTRNESLSIGVAAATATVCHTALVLGCLRAFFQALPLREVFLTIVGINGLCELAAAVAVAALVCVPLKRHLRIAG